MTTERWTEEDLRRFIRVRDSLVKTGFSQDVAEAQARRALAQRTEPERRSEEATKDDLYRDAMRFRITGRSKMDKDELAKAVAEYRREHPDA